MSRSNVMSVTCALRSPVAHRQVGQLGTGLASTHDGRNYNDQSLVPNGVDDPG